MLNAISFEEQELMSIYNASGTREGLIKDLFEMRTYLGPEDQDLKVITDSAIEKLSGMSDAEYDALDLSSIL